jgi:hypothetical protein
MNLNWRKKSSARSLNADQYREVGLCVSMMLQLREFGAWEILSAEREKQLQILRLTTPKLKNAWGPVRSG